MELVSSGGTARADRRGRPARDRRSTRSPASPRCSTTAWSRCTRRCTAASSPTAARRRISPTSNEHDIAPFDMVVSNLYPFLESPDIETIDIGGPTMTRAAAKNHAWVGDRHRSVAVRRRARRAARPQASLSSDETRRALALEAFAHTAAYDAAIVRVAPGATKRCPQHLVLALDRTDEQLRYGENPHQQAARYRTAGTTSWWDGVQQHSGLALSYLNLYDADAAWRIVHDLGEAEPGVRHHQARQPVRCRGRRRPRHRVPACARVRRALGVRRDRRAEPADRRGHRRADGRRARRPTS